MNASCCPCVIGGVKCCKGCVKCRRPFCKENKKAENLRDSGLQNNIVKKEEKTRLDVNDDKKAKDTSTKHTEEEFFLLSDAGQSFHVDDQGQRKCFQCKTILQQLTGLLEEIRDIKGKRQQIKCDHCTYKHKKEFKCPRCEYMMRDYLAQRVTEYKGRQQRYDKWLCKLKQILLAILDGDIEPSSKELKEAVSPGDELEALLQELKVPLKRHERELKISKFPAKEEAVSSATSITSSIAENLAESTKILEKVLMKLNLQDEEGKQEVGVVRNSVAAGERKRQKVLPPLKTIYKVIPKTSGQVSPSSSGFNILPSHSASTSTSTEKDGKNLEKAVVVISDINVQMKRETLLALEKARKKINEAMAKGQRKRFLGEKEKEEVKYFKAAERLRELKYATKSESKFATRAGIKWQINKERFERHRKDENEFKDKGEFGKHKKFQLQAKWSKGSKLNVSPSSITKRKKDILKKDHKQEEETSPQSGSGLKKIHAKGERKYEGEIPAEAKADRLKKEKGSKWLRLDEAPSTGTRIEETGGNGTKSEGWISSLKQSKAKGGKIEPIEYPGKWPKELKKEFSDLTQKTKSPSKKQREEKDGKLFIQHKKMSMLEKKVNQNHSRQTDDSYDDSSKVKVGKIKTIDYQGGKPKEPKKEESKVTTQKTKSPSRKQRDENDIQHKRTVNSYEESLKSKKKLAKEYTAIEKKRMNKGIRDGNVITEPLMGIDQDLDDTLLSKKMKDKKGKSYSSSPRKSKDVHINETDKFQLKGSNGKITTKKGKYSSSESYSHVESDENKENRDKEKKPSPSPKVGVESKDHKEKQKKVGATPSTKLLLTLLGEKERETKLKEAQQKQLEDDINKMKSKISPDLDMLPELDPLNVDQHFARKSVKIETYANDNAVESVVECKSESTDPEMIKGPGVVPFDPNYKKRDINNIKPVLYQVKVKCTTPPIPSIASVTDPVSSSSSNKSEIFRRKSFTSGKQKGYKSLRYELSNKEFISQGYTVLPTVKVVRKLSIYKMIPKEQDTNWFDRHREDKILKYDTGEKLAEIDDDGHGRWYYRNGIIALDYYKSEDVNVGSRYILYSDGEKDGQGRSRPITVLACFDHLGNGVVYDHYGNIRLKYNQTEGVVLDPKIGPISRWKWHSLNDPPNLHQMCIDVYAENDPRIDALIEKETVEQPSTKPIRSLKSLKSLAPMKSMNTEPRSDSEAMFAIELENFVKAKSKSFAQKYKPFQIRMKAVKINDQFSLHVASQQNICLKFSDEQVPLKLNLGMVLMADEVLDTEEADLTQIVTPYDHPLPRTNSLADIRRILKNVRRQHKHGGKVAETQYT